MLHVDSRGVVLCMLTKLQTRTEHKNAATAVNISEDNFCSRLVRSLKLGRAHLFDPLHVAACGSAIWYQRNIANYTTQCHAVGSVRLMTWDPMLRNRRILSDLVGNWWLTLYKANLAAKALYIMRKEYLINGNERRSCRVYFCFLLKIYLSKCDLFSTN